MQLEDVTIFLQIASAGSLSAAARIAGKPKATVSHQLRRLEETLGMQLFQRSANRLVLSESGAAFHEHALLIRRACDRGLDATRQIRAHLAGTIRVATAGEFSSNIVAPLVLHFARLNPELRIEVVVVRGEALLAARDGVDCILYLGEPPVAQAAELSARLLGRFEFGLYASPAYLRARGTPSQPADLLEHSRIGFHNGESITLWELKRGREEFSLQPDSRFQTNDYWVMKLAALHDHGIALMPTFFAAMEVEQGTLAPVLPRWHSRRLPMFALFASHRFANPALRRLIQALTRNFDEVLSYSYYARRNDDLGLMQEGRSG